MKKKILVGCLAVMAMLCVIGFAGCSSANENTFGLVVDQTGSVTSVSSQKKFEELKQSVPDAFSVSVQLPADYQGGKCECVAGDNELGGSYMQFIDSQNKKANCGGHLFSLHFVPADKKYEFANYKKLGQVMKDGKAVYDFVLEQPSDVQYELTDEKLTKNYQTMADEMQTIIDSAQFGGGYSLSK